MIAWQNCDDLSHPCPYNWFIFHHNEVHMWPFQGSLIQLERQETESEQEAPERKAKPYCHALDVVRYIGFAYDAYGEYGKVDPRDSIVVYYETRGSLRWIGIYRNAHRNLVKRLGCMMYLTSLTRCSGVRSQWITQRYVFIIRGLISA